MEPVNAMPETDQRKTNAGPCETCGRELVVVAETTVCPECSKILEIVTTEQWVA